MWIWLFEVAPFWCYKNSNARKKNPHLIRGINVKRHSLLLLFCMLLAFQRRQESALGMFADFLFPPILKPQFISNVWHSTWQCHIFEDQIFFAWRVTLLDVKSSVFFKANKRRKSGFLAILRNIPNVCCFVFEVKKRRNCLLLLLSSNTMFRFGQYSNQVLQRRFFDKA